jgi:hypothetical protein
MVMTPLVATVTDAERDAIIKWVASLKADASVTNPPTTKCKLKK